MPGEARPPSPPPVHIIHIIATSVYIIASLVQFLASPIYLTAYIKKNN